jgi:hypothetical protein
MPVAPDINNDQEYQTIRWVGETGTSLKAEVAMYSDITVQAVGSGTVTIEGSNDGTNWVALKDLAGAAISLAAGSNAMSVILEHPFFIRCVVAGGTATVMALGAGNR